MKKFVILVISLAMVWCLAGCKTINVNNNSGGTQTVVQGIGPNEVPLSGEQIKGGIQKKQTESIENIDLQDEGGNPIDVTPNSSISSELEGEFPSPDGYEWEGFITEPVYAPAGQSFTLSFEIAQATEYHEVIERGTFVGDLWDDGYSGSMYIGPEPRPVGYSNAWLISTIIILTIAGGFLIYRHKRLFA